MGKRKREKKPVLTSPWKIGALVALMVSATSFGVGYYMVRVYNIDLYWLGSDVSKWGVDSYEFFREIYPAAAGVLLLSLLTYFLIASAVRRYRYYLNSGQDYRKMISLADSIDDLTNPAQIARLSEYPELQSVLRNYGDQIREISQGMESREEELRSVDLEVEIDSILQGNGMNAPLADGKWWAPIAKKVQAMMENADGGPDEGRDQAESTRKAFGIASLSCGRAVETASSARDDILGVTEAVERLNDIAQRLASAAGEPGAAAQPPGQASAIEGAAASLERNCAAIRDLSEESNGLALNMALMAARGDVTEKDLAGLAEKVRSAAERFGKLGKELGGTVSVIMGSSGGAGYSTAGADGGDREAAREVAEIARVIESLGGSLRQKLGSLSGDVEEIKNILQPEQASQPEQATDESELDGADRIRNTDGSIVNFGAGEDPAEDGELVIDHGKLWEGPSMMSDESAGAAEETAEKEAEAASEEVAEGSDDLLISGFQDATGAMQPQKAGQPDDAAPAAAEESAEQPVMEQAASPGGMQEPGAEDGPAATDEVTDEIFACEQPVEDSWEDMQAQSEQLSDAAPAAADETPVQAGQADAAQSEVVSQSGAEAPAQEDINGSGEEPVYDLFELGAVEYVEETEVNL